MTSQGKSILKLNDVRKSFGGIQAVNGVDLDVLGGEILGLIGANGAGKTTLFNLITGFHRADSGAILFKEQNITSVRPDQICKLGIARTFQIVRPMNRLTLTENVMVGAFNRVDAPKEAREIAEECLELVGLYPKRNLLAKSVNVVDRKRMEIARALSTRPSVLLLDEAISGLNPSETDEMVALIVKINQSGTTLVVIEHVMRVIMSISHRVALLNFGTKLLEGKADEVARDPRSIEIYLGKS